MSEESPQPVRKRGDAAFNEVRRQVAERNEEARKAGKLRREHFDRLRARSQDADDARSRAEYEALQRRTGS